MQRLLPITVNSVIKLCCLWLKVKFQKDIQIFKYSLSMDSLSSNPSLQKREFTMQINFVSLENSYWKTKQNI